MTTPTVPQRTGARPTDGRPRRVDLAMARAHLRLGSLALARAELETLAGLATLDGPGLVDLAEVRWRTGDLPGAGEAAAVALETGADEPVALLIAAEAASADGRPSEARRLARLAMLRLDGQIDRVFAGMPRSPVWPPDAAEPPPTAATMFHRDNDEEVALAAIRRGAAKVQDGGAVPTAASSRPVTEPSSDGADAADGPGGPLTLGFWDTGSGESPPAETPDPDEAFQAGRAALMSGSSEEAAFRFGLAIRFAPALAPAVLEATEGARSVPLIMVRGDAYRLVGHESEARQAYTLAALGGPPERRRRPRTEQRPDQPAGAPDPGPLAAVQPDPAPGGDACRFAGRGGSDCRSHCPDAGRGRGRPVDAHAAQCRDADTDAAAATPDANAAAATTLRRPLQPRRRPSGPGGVRKAAIAAGATASIRGNGEIDAPDPNERAAADVAPEG